MNCRPTVAALLLAAAAAAQSQSGGEPPPRTPYDPLRGMDQDGRIPKPEVPPDITHPDRWRYTPEARMKPGSVFERFLVSSFISPILFREADIGFGGGVALTDVDFRDQRYREFANIVLTHSEEGQQAYKINWQRWLQHRELPQGGVYREERSRVYARAGYEKTLTRRFFGFGSRTRADDETSYTEELTTAGVGLRVSLPDPGSDWVVRTDLQAEHHGLSRGRVIDVPSTEEVGAFADDVAAADGVTQLWSLNTFGWDTRDSMHQPYEGIRIGSMANVCYGEGGETGAIVGVDGQHVFALPPLLHRGAVGREENPPTDVLAFGAFVQDTVGELPFYSLPTLGGTNTLRGYIQNRFTDDALAHFSVEYRVSLLSRGVVFTESLRIERVGLGVFYDCGTVASGIADLADGRYLDSYGLGFRVAFSREAVFRIDWGFSDEGTNFTLAFGNSF